jgi:hypothetical protein
MRSKTRGLCSTDGRASASRSSTCSLYARAQGPLRLCRLLTRHTTAPSSSPTATETALQATTSRQLAALCTTTVPSTICAGTPASHARRRRRQRFSTQWRRSQPRVTLAPWSSSTSGVPARMKYWARGPSIFSTRTMGRTRLQPRCWRGYFSGRSPRCHCQQRRTWSSRQQTSH